MAFTYNFLKYSRNLIDLTEAVINETYSTLEKCMYIPRRRSPCRPFSIHHCVSN
jgi:hypothetical protein